MRKFLFLSVAAMLPLAASTWADVLILRDGGHHVGRFVSGSGSSIVFQDDSGARHTYNVREVQSLDFDRGTSARRSNSSAINTDQASRHSGRSAARSYSSSTDRNSSVRTDETTRTRAAASRTIPAGTSIAVRTDESIDSTSTSEGRTFPATVDRDIVDDSGNVLVPKGSSAELVVRDMRSGGTTGSPELVLDLQSLHVNGQRYLVSTESVTQSNRQGLGKNKRTGEMVGGGAALGTLLGAIAGGGKGAAIGAVAGAAAGAGTQVLTRGKEVRVPAETELTFKLDRPVYLVPAR